MSSIRMYLKTCFHEVLRRPLNQQKLPNPIAFLAFALVPEDRDSGASNVSEALHGASCDSDSFSSGCL